MDALALPRIAVRGRSFMALVLEPEVPLDAWLERLDRHIAISAEFFADRPVIANLAAAASAGPAVPAEALDALGRRTLRLVGIEGIDPARLAGTCWERLPTLGRGHDHRREPRADRPGAGSHAPSLLIEGPVRSGQSILFEDGDVTVVGAIASGAEVMAGGSIHVYGALRGRAIAGMRGGGARIFCQRLEAEFVAVEQLYRTAEHWGEGLHGAAVQIRRDRGSLRLTPLA